MDRIVDIEQLKKMLLETTDEIRKILLKSEIAILEETLNSIK